MEKELSLLRRSELGLEVSETVSSEESESSLELEVSSEELELLPDEEELMLELLVTEELIRVAASLPALS